MHPGVLRCRQPVLCLIGMLHVQFATGFDLGILCYLPSHLCASPPLSITIPLHQCRHLAAASNFFPLELPMQSPPQTPIMAMEVFPLRRLKNQHLLAPSLRVSTATAEVATVLHTLIKVLQPCSFLVGFNVHEDGAFTINGQLCPKFYIRLLTNLVI